MSNKDLIEIDNIDKRFLPYLELNRELKRIESYKCPFPGCSFRTKQGPGEVRMHTLLQTQNVVSNDDPKGVDQKAHMEYFKKNDLLTIENVKMLGRTDTRPYNERDV